MQPAGHIVQQGIERLSRPVQAYDRWAARIPSEYRSSILNAIDQNISSQTDNHCLARIKHYRSLVSMALEARKPMYQLTSADGAIGNHSYAVTEARAQFKALAKTIRARVGIST